MKATTKARLLAGAGLAVVLALVGAGLAVVLALLASAGVALWVILVVGQVRRRPSRLAEQVPGWQRARRQEEVT